jgi:hypothetical protein
MAGRTGIRLSGLLCVAVLVAGVGRSQDRSGATTGAPDSPIAPLLQQDLPAEVGAAVQNAAQKLRDPRCQKIFSDFRDRAGRQLEEKLESLHQTGRGYLEWMVFYDEGGKPVCRESSVLAATSPGSRLVRICREQFRSRAHRDPGLGAVTIIHEELHSLGLGENPPDSREITAQVIARCGK